MGYASASAIAPGRGTSRSLPRIVRLAAAAGSVAIRRHWYGTGYTCWAFSVIAPKRTTYAARVAIAGCPAYAAPAKKRAATASEARWKPGLRASSSTSHGESSPSASDSQHATSSRYVRTNAYVRRASRSSSIEYAKAGHAVRKAISRKTTADEMRTATE